MECLLIYFLLPIQVVILICILVTLFKMIREDILEKSESKPSKLVKIAKPLGFYKDRAPSGRVLRDEELPLEQLKKRYPNNSERVDRVLKEKEIEQQVDMDMEYYNKEVEEGRATYPELIAKMPPFKHFGGNVFIVMLNEFALKTDDKVKLRLLLQSKYYQEYGLI